MAVLADVMRTELIMVAPEDTLGEVAQRMVDEQRGGAALVKDFGRLIGILTERDMLKAIAGRVHTSDARVREWMTPDPVTAPPEMELEEASRIMLERRFRHLPVIDDGQLVGIASLRRVAAGMHPDVENP